MRKITLYHNGITSGFFECPISQWSLEPWAGDFAEYQGYTGEDAVYAIPDSWNEDENKLGLRDAEDIHCALFGEDYPCVYDMSGKHDIPKVGYELSVSSAAWVLGISEQRVRQLIEAGTLKARRLGKKVLLIDWDSFESYAEAEHNPGRPRKKQ